MNNAPVSYTHLAKDNSVKAVIIAGDLYDKKNISANARNVFLSAINNNPDITFYYLRGNHDAESLFIDCDTIPDLSLIHI